MTATKPLVLINGKIQGIPNNFTLDSGDGFNNETGIFNFQKQSVTGFTITANPIGAGIENWSAGTTSVTYSQTQATSGNGAAWVIRAQKGKNAVGLSVGTTGGSMTLASADGGDGIIGVAPGSGGNLILLAGSGGTIADSGGGSGGNVTIDAGIGTGVGEFSGVNGNVSIGAVNAAGVNIGRSDKTTTVVGFFSALENVSLGVDSLDLILFNGSFATDIIPSTDNTFELGASDKRLQNIHSSLISIRADTTNTILAQLSPNSIDIYTDYFINVVIQPSATLAGHAISISTGLGGDAGGGNPGGAGGAINITGGNGGAGDGSDTAGIGGKITIKAGNGGSDGGAGGAVGGLLELRGGDGSDGSVGGGIDLYTGIGADYGVINFNIGAEGDHSLAAFLTRSDAVITDALHLGIARGHDFLIIHDQSSTASATGKLIAIIAQTTTGTTSTGGRVIINAGSGTTSGGDVSIESGGGITNGNGGHIAIRTGDGAGAGTDGNITFFLGTGSYGGGERVMFIGNRTTAPSSNPTDGGILYVESGALKFRGSGGTTTTIAPA